MNNNNNINNNGINGAKKGDINIINFDTTEPAGSFDRKKFMDEEIIPYIKNIDVNLPCSCQHCCELMEFCIHKTPFILKRYYKYNKDSSYHYEIFIPNKYNNIRPKLTGIIIKNINELADIIDEFFKIIKSESSLLMYLL